ncbi:MAG: hypothetical protein ACRDMJ_05140 [Solirubrobacteraceae bacterium]
MRLRLGVGAALLTGGLAAIACGGQPAVATSAPAQTSNSAVSRVPGRITSAAAGTDWTQFDYDAQRSGAGPARTGIRAGHLRLLRLRIARVDGVVDSSPV